MELGKWGDIKDDFQESTLILGNGFSIGIYDKFKYDSLWNEAKNEPACGETKEPLSKELCSLAKELGTGTNFELLLRQLYTAKVVNEKLKLDAEHVIKCNYAKLRNALIDTIKEIHCDLNDVQCKLHQRIVFLKQFNTVFSLSYDLLIYWIINLNTETQQLFGDGFLNGVFDYDRWETFRERMNKPTLIYSPHGALHLVQDKNGEVKKIQRTGSNSLLSQITNAWLDDQNKVHPLFVAEGTSNEKLRAIQSNAYLNTVYQQILPKSIKDDCNLVIFGWAMKRLDQHLIKKIASSEPKNIAIGIHHLCDKEDECRRISSQLGNLNNCALKFFEIEEDFFE